MQRKETKDDTDTHTHTHTMFLDLKNQYCQNDYTTQGSVLTQCNLYQITKGTASED